MARRFNRDKFLRELDRQGISQRRLSRLIDPDDERHADQIRTRISKHVKGHTDPTMRVMQRYADALGITVDEFTDEVDEDAEMRALLKQVLRLRARQQKRQARRAA